MLCLNVIEARCKGAKVEEMTAYSGTGPAGNIEESRQAKLRSARVRARASLPECDRGDL